MALPQVLPVDSTITFFGTCPTTWDDLTPEQKGSCIDPVHLTRQIDGYYAWAAVGELARQWNKNGYQEYSAVINQTKFHIGRSIVCREEIASYELRLLSTTLSRERAKPFVIITSKNIKRAREIFSRLEQHPRLSKFGLNYMARQGELRCTAGDPPTPSLGPINPQGKSLSCLIFGARIKLISPDAFIQSNGNRAPTISTKSSSYNQAARTSQSSLSLCGARIAVYKHEGGISGKKKMATIGGVFQIGGKYKALTAAYVFFDKIASEDSGICVTTDGSSSMDQDNPRPVMSDLYEIVVESFWPHMTDGASRTTVISMGLFEPQLTRHRKGLETKNTSELIWNLEMDWALLELRNPMTWDLIFFKSPPV